MDRTIHVMTSLYKLHCRLIFAAYLKDTRPRLPTQHMELSSG
jgi:hypothetical protein